MLNRYGKLPAPVTAQVELIHKVSVLGGIFVDA
jgi:hypothetical protein